MRPVSERDLQGMRPTAPIREVDDGIWRRHERQEAADLANVNIARISLLAELEEALRRSERERWPANPDWLDDAAWWLMNDESSW
jgi:hypothetical protein